MSPETVDRKKKEVFSNSKASPPQNINRATTKFTEDVFTDEINLLEPHLNVNYSVYLKRLWDSNTDIHNILITSANLETARDKLFTYLEKLERNIFSIDNDLHILQKAIVRESIRVFKSIIGPINEHRTKFSALNGLWKLANAKQDELKNQLSVGFLLEFIYLFKGVTGQANIYADDGDIKKGIPEFLKLKGRQAAVARSAILDDLGTAVKKFFKKYPSGLEEEVITWREENRDRIIKYFNATSEDWNNYQWQLKNVIKEPKPLIDIIKLSRLQAETITNAVNSKIPFGITPYYLSLIDSRPGIGYDHAIRAQVIPPKEYVDTLSKNKELRASLFDFMGEHDTSPVNLITRRYPIIAIIKPYNTCAQICVYCQRNWEIEGVLDPKAAATKPDMENALSWFDKHKSVSDVLITGGDPLIMKDFLLERILEILSAKKHIYRIRIGTRTPVVLPMRWTYELINLLLRYHQPPKREIAVVTHFEHSYEITPEAMEAVQRIKKVGINVYNQQVFTIENSRKFETSKLRVDLKKIGVDPYYLFNMKGKEETRRYMVPIARILQERKEEARLLPGLDRTDEPVFNVPRLGKNHLRAWQDHRLVMILPDGSRVYELHPWEKNISAVPPYNYTDVPIYEYLEELAARGENLKDYKTIWYYY